MIFDLKKVFRTALTYIFLDFSIKKRYALLWVVHNKNIIPVGY